MTNREKFKEKLKSFFAMNAELDDSTKDTMVENMATTLDNSGYLYDDDGMPYLLGG